MIRLNRNRSTVSLHAARAVFSDEELTGRISQVTYKTILLHMANDIGHKARLNAAADLAKRFQAQVLALYVANPVSMPAAIEGRGASYAFMAEATAIAHEKAEALRHECETVCTAGGVSWEWKVVEGDHLDLLALEAPYADLAIVSHSKIEVLEDRIVFHVPENLPLVVGCPVIVLPEAGFNRPIARHAMIAWQPCTPAARAVHLALPFLTAAEKVTLCSVTGEDVTAEDCERIAAHLARHGVEAKTIIATAERRHVGETILAEAGKAGADTLVMGAYGHSRVREVVLGGVTRYVSQHAKIPLLVSH